MGFLVNFEAVAVAVSELAVLVVIASLLESIAMSQKVLETSLALVRQLCNSIDGMA